jgi:Ca-activated chloride channel family protein
MRVRTAVLAAILGMALTSAAATRVPLLGVTPIPVAGRDDPAADAGLLSAAGASFGQEGQDGPVRFEGRLGNPTIAKRTAGASGESYLLVTLHGSDGKSAAVSPPVHLAVVIDRSGSMRGSRIENAIAAATGLVEHLRPRDSVSVVSFDTQSQVVVPPTAIDDSTRAGILSAIRSIQVGGDTCISCGLEEGMHQMREADGAGELASGEVRRMVLLSDGATNHGIRDLPGLRALAGRLRDAGCSVSTVGLDVDFDEKVMAAIATESNGNHYFVRDASNLASIFRSELDAVESTVANDVDLSVDLAPGVEVDEVLDRAFTRTTGPNGPRIQVPFGAIRAGEDKTLIARVHVRADVPGSEPVANVTLHYRDIAGARDRQASADLAVTIGDATSALDPLVGVRLDRAKTAATLLEANDLFASGQTVQATNLLNAQKAKLDVEKSAVARRASSGGLGSSDAFGADKDLDRQRAALSSAAAPFAPATSASGASHHAAAPAPTSAEGKALRKENQAAAGPLKF